MASGGFNRVYSESAGYRALKVGKDCGDFQSTTPSSGASDPTNRNRRSRGYQAAGGCRGDRGNVGPAALPYTSAHG
jgi:hypothetical protein